MALPASVNSVLIARVDRLVANDRKLLQAASVIGRRFDPELLAAVAGEAAVYAELAAMQTLDLVRPEGRSGDYEFKHALVRDALYESLLEEARTTLHLKIAEELERRSGNRLTELAEVLAYHYSQTDHTDKAFIYLSLAGSKNLSVYSLEEAGVRFAAALSVIDKNPNCASDDQVADFLVSYLLLLNMNIKMYSMIQLVERYLGRIDHLGDDPRAVLIRHHYVFALFWSKRYREAAVAQRQTSQMADRLDDVRSKAYALAGEIHLSTVIAPKPIQEFELLKREAIKAASETTDTHIQNWIRLVIGWEEMHRGRIVEARHVATMLIQIGHQLDDPRSTGLGLALLSWIAVVTDSYAEALEYGERSLAVAITPWDRGTANNAMASALVLTRQIERASILLEELHRRIIVDGDLYSWTSCDGVVGVCKVLEGNISGGIRHLQDAIAQRESEGYRTAADWYRFLLSEVYLQIIEHNEKLPFVEFVKNVPILIKVSLSASTRIRALERYPNGLNRLGDSRIG